MPNKANDIRHFADGENMGTIRTAVLNPLIDKVNAMSGDVTSNKGDIQDLKGVSWVPEGSSGIKTSTPRGNITVSGNTNLLGNTSVTGNLLLNGAPVGSTPQMYDFSSAVRDADIKYDKPSGKIVIDCDKVVRHFESTDHSVNVDSVELEGKCKIDITTTAPISFLGFFDRTDDLFAEAIKHPSKLSYAVTHGYVRHKPKGYPPSGIVDLKLAAQYQIYKWDMADRVAPTENEIKDPQNWDARQWLSCDGFGITMVGPGTRYPLWTPNDASKDPTAKVHEGQLIWDVASKTWYWSTGARWEAHAIVSANHFRGFFNNADELPTKDLINNKSYAYVLTAQSAAGGAAEAREIPQLYLYSKGGSATPASWEAQYTKGAFISSWGNTPGKNKDLPVQELTFEGTTERDITYDKTKRKLTLKIPEAGKIAVDVGTTTPEIKRVNLIKSKDAIRFTATSEGDNTILEVGSKFSGKVGAGQANSILGVELNGNTGGSKINSSNILEIDIPQLEHEKTDGTKEKVTVIKAGAGVTIDQANGDITINSTGGGVAGFEAFKSDGTSLGRFDKVKAGDNLTFSDDSGKLKVSSSASAPSSDTFSSSDNSIGVTKTGTAVDIKLPQSEVMRQRVLVAMDPNQGDSTGGVLSNEGDVDFSTVTGGQKIKAEVNADSLVTKVQSNLADDSEVTAIISGSAGSKRLKFNLDNPKLAGRLHKDIFKNSDTVTVSKEGDSISFTAKAVGTGSIKVSGSETDTSKPITELPMDSLVFKDWDFSIKAEDNSKPNKYTVSSKGFSVGKKSSSPETGINVLELEGEGVTVSKQGKTAKIKIDSTPGLTVKGKSIISDVVEGVPAQLTFDDVFSIDKDTTDNTNYKVRLRHEGALLGIFDGQVALKTAAKLHKGEFVKGKIVGLTRGAISGKTTRFQVWYWNSDSIPYPSTTDIDNPNNWASDSSLPALGFSIGSTSTVPVNNTHPITSYKGQILYCTLDNNFYYCTNTAWNLMVLGGTGSAIKISGQGDSGQIVDAGMKAINFHARDFRIKKTEGKPESDQDYTIKYRGTLVTDATTASETSIADVHAWKFKGSGVTITQEGSDDNHIAVIDISGGGGASTGIKVTGKDYKESSTVDVTQEGVTHLDFGAHMDTEVITAESETYIRVNPRGLQVGGQSSEGVPITADDVHLVKFNGASVSKTGDVVEVTLPPTGSIQATCAGTMQDAGSHTVVPGTFLPISKIDVTGDAEWSSIEDGELTISLKGSVATEKNLKDLTTNRPPDQNINRIGRTTDNDTMWYCTGAKWEAFGYDHMPELVTSLEHRFPKKLRLEGAYSEAEGRQTGLMHISAETAGTGTQETHLNLPIPEEGFLLNLYSEVTKEGQLLPRWTQAFYAIESGNVWNRSHVTGTNTGWNLWKRQGEMGDDCYSVLVLDNDIKMTTVAAETNTMPYLVYQDPRANIILSDKPSVEGTYRGDFEVRHSGLYDLHCVVQFTAENLSISQEEIKRSGAYIQIMQEDALVSKVMIANGTGQNYPLWDATASEFKPFYGAFTNIKLEAGKLYRVVASFNETSHQEVQQLAFDPYKNMLAIDPAKSRSKTALNVLNMLYRTLGGLSFAIGYEIRTQGGTSSSGIRVYGEKYLTDYVELK